MTLHRFTFRAMAAENEVQIHGEDGALAAGAAAHAIAEVNRIEAKYSRYRADTEVSRINAAAGGAPVAIDAETRGLLAYADACFRESGGLFDATSVWSSLSIGVLGLLLAAFGIFAPPLDAAGNSVKGQLAAKFLSQHLGMDLFVSKPER